MDTSTPPPGRAPEAWAAPPLAVQPFLLATRTVLTLQPQQMVPRSARVADLDARLKQHARNASNPPSSDPPAAPPRPPRLPRGRKPSGQAGHPRHDRPAPAPDQITTTRHHAPSTCPTCGNDLTAQRHAACAIQIHSVWEVPLGSPQLTADQSQTVWCQRGGVLVTAERPADGPPGAFGPRTAARVRLLHGRYRSRHREVVHLLAALFQLPLSLGSVVTLQTTVRRRRWPIWMRPAGKKPANAADCGAWCLPWRPAFRWPRAGTVQRCATCGAARSAGASDRIAIDPPWRCRPRHQLCWSHLVRSFQALVDRGGRGGVWGADFLELRHLLFRRWHLFRAGRIDRALRQAAMVPIQPALHGLLVPGARRCAAPERLCQALLAHDAALWTFVREDSVEPTNNAADQALRPAVLWRKGWCGAHSAAGTPFVERILTGSATGAQPHGHLLTFLTAAVDAFWRGQPAPKLVELRERLLNSALALATSKLISRLKSTLLLSPCNMRLRSWFSVSM